MTTTSKPPTVMVVDDDEVTRDVMQEMLHRAGVVNIHMEEDGHKALRALAALPQAPDLLICDIYMPNMDGFEFLTALQKLNYSGRILLMSGVSAETLQLARDIALNMGLQLVGVQMKPLSKDMLALVLQPSP